MRAPVSDAVVIVDVLTFSTAVVVAAAAGLNSDDVAPRLRDGASSTLRSRIRP